MLPGMVLRYVCVGVLGTAVHLGVLVFVVELLHGPPVLGSCLGFGGALGVSYLLNRRWTFDSSAPLAGSLWRYVCVSLLGLGLNLATLFTLVTLARWHYFHAQLVTVVIVPASNFLLNRFWTFSPQRQAG